MAFSWLYKEKVKGLIVTARKGYSLCKGLLLFKSLLIQNVIISILLCVGGLSQITTDQEDENICKILTIENPPPDIGFKT